MSTLMDIIKNRRSIRKYQIKEVSKDIIEEILDAGRLAPSAKNRQPWHFVVIQDKTRKNDIAELMEQYAEKAEQEEYENQHCKSSVKNTALAIKKAPVLILIFKNKDSNWEIGDNLSIGACIENMLLCATSLDIGSLWIRDTYCVNKEVSETYGNSKELVCAVALGYSAEHPDMRPRKNLSTLVDWY